MKQEFRFVLGVLWAALLDVFQSAKWAWVDAWAKVKDPEARAKRRREAWEAAPENTLYMRAKALGEFLTGGNAKGISHEDLPAARLGVELKLYRLVHEGGRWKVRK